MTDPRLAALEQRVGLKFGNYVLQRVLGKGSMGAVYMARDEALLRPTAVKILSWDLEDTFGQDPMEWFLDEARSVARINHPRVVQIYAAAKQSETCYIAMEFVDGPSAEMLVIKEGPLSVERATRMLLDVATALQAAHDAGVIHRDVKPANILVSAATGRAKLGDFGMALSTRTRREGKGAIRAGTAFYTAPENWQGMLATARSDIYALGATYYYLLTGRPPYVAESTAAVREMHLFAEVPDPRRLRASLPAAVADLVQRTMAKSAQMRFESAGGLAAQARALLRELADGTPSSVYHGPTAEAEASAAAEVTPSLPTFALPSGVFEKPLGFVRQPFAAVDLAELPYQEGPFAAASASIQDCIQRQVMAIGLVGPIGTGRSVLLQWLTQQLAGSHSVLLVQPPAGATAGQLTRSVGLALGMGDAPFDNLVAQLPNICERAETTRGFPLLIVDELSPSTWVEASQIAALSRRTRKFSLLLCANEVLRERVNELVETCISMSRLSVSEGEDYLEAWLKSSLAPGMLPLLFTPDARLILVCRAQGTMSRLNLLATNATVLAVAAGRRIVTSFEAWVAKEDVSGLVASAALRRDLPKRPKTWPPDEVQSALRRFRSFGYGNSSSS